jgi:hypothetical protein
VLTLGGRRTAVAGQDEKRPAEQFSKPLVWRYKDLQRG